MNLTNAPIMLSQVTDATQTSAFPVPVQIPPCLCLHRVHFLRLQIQERKETVPAYFRYRHSVLADDMALRKSRAISTLSARSSCSLSIAAAVTAIVFKPRKEDKADTPADVSSEDKNSTEEVSGDDSEE